MIIDLRSDTVTQPNAAMKEAMFAAPLGDDVFGEEPTVLALEKKCAALFGMEAALYCPSGTMTNQIAIQVHTKPLQEIICDKNSHIYKYEVGGWAHHSGVSIKLVDGDRGRMKPSHITDNINEDYDWLPVTSLVVAENTVNRGGGSIYPFNDLKALSETAKQNELKFHLDGARIFNAIVESDYSAKDIGSLFDSISICLSKGLGAPVGSVLLGKKDFIRAARRTRKVMGGGMRQAGIIAAGGLFAIENNIERLKEDHKRAKQMGEVLSSLNYVEEVMPADTNILIFKLVIEMRGADFIKQLEQKNIKAIEFGPQMVRFVTHLDFTDDMLEKTTAVLNSIKL